MVRVAIAGTGGLARYIAHFIKDETSHTAVILSRSVRGRLHDCRSLNPRDLSSSLVILPGWGLRPYGRSFFAQNNTIARAKCPLD
jgi:hypothetical protein